MSFIFLRNRVTGGAAFSPASLFASGEEGAWYEPSTTTCFTDTGGTTAASVGDAVARINDLSGNGNHATQATEAARPILARVPPRGRVNELSETDTLATQSVTVTAAQRTLSFTGTGTVTLTGASTAGPLVGTGAGDRVSLTFTPSAGTLTLTVLGTVTDAQLELGASATTYQSVADSLGYDITEAGVTSLEYLAFDGSDDCMATAAIDFTATDEMSIFGGWTRETNAIAIVKYEFSAVWSTNTGTFIFATNGSGNLNAGSRGTAYSLTNDNTKQSVPSTYITSALSKISTDQMDLRVDGVLTSSVSTDQGSGNYANEILHIGARDTLVTPQYYFNGRLFSLIVRGATSTAQEISDTESYVATKSGVTL